MSTKITQAVVDATVHQQYDNDLNDNWGWDDLATSLTGRLMTKTRGAIDTEWDDNSIKFQPWAGAGDSFDEWFEDDDNYATLSLQKMHSIPEPGGEMRLHIHWEQTYVGGVIWAIQYRIQDNGGEKTLDWTNAPVIPVGSGQEAFEYTQDDEDNGVIRNQITKLVNINLTGTVISSTVQFRLARVDVVGSGNGNIFATFIDAHVNYDQDRGSRQEYVK